MAKNWAICIGVNEYDNLPTLQYAQRDAELFRDFLLNEAGFDKVYLFTDDSPPITDAGKPFASQPSGGRLKNFLRRRFDKRFLDTGDNLWFFFSGHGLRHADRDYLMPSDADPHPQGIEDTALTLNYVTERLRRCGADNVVLFLDACRNQLGSKGVTAGEQKPQGVITIASCSPDEQSYEIEAFKQGAFTYALLESLRIQGEGNCATVERLYQRLRHRVAEINRQHRKPEQTPYAIAEPASKYHLILLPRQATLQDIANLKIDAQEAELEGDLNLAEQLWTRVLAVSPADPQVLAAYRRIIIKQSGATVPPQPRQTRPRTQQVSSRSASVRATRSDSRERSPAIQIPKVNLNIDRLTRRRLLQFGGTAGAGVSLFLLARELLPPDIESKDPIPSSTPVATDEFEFETVTVNAEGQETQRSKNKAKYFTEDLGNGVTLEMVSIPGGKFMMGSPEGEGSDDEKPQHKVTVKPFFMGKSQVTQAQWKVVASLPKIERDLEADPSRFKGDNLPVEKVFWYHAEEFCARLSKLTGKEYRLPSEAEWEYACRAGTTTPFYFGETITSELANYDASRTYANEPEGKYREQTTPVGSFPPNAFGLYDMHGNVWEWCADHWHDNYQGAPTDGSVWETGGNEEYPVIRGGSWTYYPAYCRSAYRYFVVRRGDISDAIGFRVVCVAPRTL